MCGKILGNKVAPVNKKQSTSKSEGTESLKMEFYDPCYKRECRRKARLVWRLKNVILRQ